MSNDAKCDTAPDREWLIATGDGGYALGTVSGVATRRYHGQLVAALPPPVGRMMVWPRNEELVAIDGRRVGLRQGWYEGAVLAPEDHVEPTAFELDHGIPTWRFDVAGVTIERRLVVAAGTATMSWRLIDGGSATLHVRPLITWRSHHHLRDAADARPARELHAQHLRWRRDAESPWVRVGWDGDLFDDEPHRYRSAWLPTEEMRGYDATEDLFAPVGIRMELGAEPLRLTVAVEGVFDAERVPVDASIHDRARAAFVIRHPDGRRGVIAGYPWFTEWARDTMIALPGLLLPERPELARDVLTAWAERLDRGLLPCQLRDVGDGPLHTNTADAPLRMVQAVAILHDHDPALVPDELIDAVDQIVDAYHHGTGHGIRVEDDGLLAAGEAGHALTWMDAISPEGPVTPRRGKPIDLNALYLVGLRFAADRAEARGDAARSDALRGRATRCAEGMAEAFVDPDTGLIRDVADPEDAVTIEPLRPNVCVALAMDGVPWPRGVAEATLDAVEEHLLTPYGMRTLSPEHPDYIGNYEGDQPSRDRAYHQGTVWPWLIGSYVDATLRVRGDTPEVRARMRAALSTLMTDLEANGSLYEVYDGDAPHHPGGCPAQAWSVSEVLRAWKRVSEDG